MISITKLYDNALGSNNAILFNSDYYRIVLVLGLFLVVLMVVLNIFFIPDFGINGAGIATFIAIFAYNTIKLFFVYKTFKMFPFTRFTLRIALLILVCVFLFYFWEFPFHPIVNITFKSMNYVCFVLLLVQQTLKRYVF